MDAVVKQEVLSGNRLHYTLLTGQGPPKGWVSLTFKGCMLVEPCTAEGGQLVVPRTCRPACEVNVPLKDHPATRLRSIETFRAKGSTRKEKDAFKSRIDQRLGGEIYGLPIPHTPEEFMSPDFGAEWLTKAFHMAGTLPEDNSVMKITTWKRLLVGGSGPKTLFSVEYAKPDNHLDTSFFSKHPWSLEENAEQRFRECGNYNFGDVPGGEVNFNVFVSRYIPFPIPKYYFADMNRDSTEYICINAAVDFPNREKTSFGPYQALPPIKKAQDWRMGKDIIGCYFALFKRLGQLFGSGKNGLLGPNLENTEWEATNLGPGGIAKREPGLAKYARQFIEENSPHLFPKGMARDKSFLDKFLVQMDEIAVNSHIIMQYQLDDPKYVGFCHANGNADNAWFYRNGQGVLECGLLDWGQFGPMNFANICAQAMGASDGVSLAECDDQLCQAFADGYHATGAPALEMSQLILRFRLDVLARTELTLTMALKFLAKQYQEVVFKEWPYYEHEPTWDLHGHTLFEFVMFHSKVVLNWKRQDVYWKTWQQFCKRPDMRDKIQSAKKSE